MSDAPLHNRSTIAYVAIGLLTTAVGGLLVIVLAPFLDFSKSHLPPKRNSDEIERVSPPRPAAPGPSGVNGHSTKPANAAMSIATSVQSEAAAAEYDSLQNRFTAVESTLKTRAQDLGSQPLKPEIISSLETVRSDLAAARHALSVGNLPAAALRMQRAKDALKYLESL